MYFVEFSPSKEVINMQSIIDFLAKPQIIAIIAYIGAIISIINISITLKNELQKRPLLKIEFPRSDIVLFRQSTNEIWPNGFALLFIKLTNKSATPLHISSLELICHNCKRIFDATTPIYKTFYLNELEYITIGSENNVLHPEFKIEPLASLQGFVYFEDLSISDGTCELIVNSPRKLFKTTFIARKVT
jgi:hypothetical protein